MGGESAKLRWSEGWSQSVLVKRREAIHAQRQLTRLANIASPLHGPITNLFAPGAFPTIVRVGVVAGIIFIRLLASGQESPFTGETTRAESVFFSNHDCNSHSSRNTICQEEL